MSSTGISSTGARPHDGDATAARSNRAHVATGALALLPGALTVYVAFHSGGYFPTMPAVTAIVLLVLLAGRLMLAQDPLGGFNRWLVVAVVALALFSGWTLLSGAWSDAPGRALIEFDRALLYLVALVLFGSLARRPGSLGVMVKGMALACLTVCAVALLTRITPGIWPIDFHSATNRLSYPITYWNTLGLLGALGTVLCVSLTAGDREPPIVRVVAAAATPVLACTIVLTLSRGAFVASAVGVLAWIVCARPRALAGAALAVVPTVALAATVTYAAERLVSDDYAGHAARAQGKTVAIVLLACIAGAAGLRALGLRLDARSDRGSAGARRLPRRRVAGAAATAILVAVLFAGLSGRVAGELDRFVNSDPSAVSQSRGDLRGRLTDPGNNGRFDLWRVSLDSFADAPFHGSGAGTFELAWNRDRPRAVVVNEGHSLYLEVLGELGVIGFALIACIVLTLLIGLGRRARGPDRGPQAAAFAYVLTWAAAAAIDWHWEMPVVTLGAFALGAAGLAAVARPPAAARAPGLPARVLLAGLACALIVLVPDRVGISQNRLERAVAYARALDCGEATRAAQDSISAVDSRAEPYELLGYCALREQRPAVALARYGQAINRDPRDWRPRYGLTVALAASGRDPRPYARLTRRLNPQGPATNDLVDRFRGNDRDEWRADARNAPLPLPGS